MGVMFLSAQTWHFPPANSSLQVCGPLEVLLLKDDKSVEAEPPEVNAWALRPSARNRTLWRRGYLMMAPFILHFPWAICIYLLCMFGVCDYQHFKDQLASDPVTFPSPRHPALFSPPFFSRTIMSGEVLLLACKSWVGPIPPWRNPDESLFAKSSNVNTKTTALTCSPRPLQHPSGKIPLWCFLIGLKMPFSHLKKKEKRLFWNEECFHFVCLFVLITDNDRQWIICINFTAKATNTKQMRWYKRQIWVCVHAILLED